MIYVKGLKIRLQRYIGFRKCEYVQTMTRFLSFLLNEFEDRGSNIVKVLKGV